MYKYTYIYICKNIDGVHVARSHLLGIVPEDIFVVYTALFSKYYIYKYNEIEIFEPMFTSIEYMLELETVDYQPCERIRNLWDLIEDMDSSNSLSIIRASKKSKTTEEYLQKLSESSKTIKFITKSLLSMDFLTMDKIKNPGYFDELIANLSDRSKSLGELQVYIASFERYIKYMEETTNGCGN